MRSCVFTIEKANEYTTPAADHSFVVLNIQNKYLCVFVPN